MNKEYKVVNLLDGIVVFVIARSWDKALAKGRAWFGTTMVRPI